jgi:hypothetical protein
MAFWLQADPVKCFLQLLTPVSSPVSQLESESEFEIVTQLDRGHWNATIFTSIVRASLRLQRDPMSRQIGEEICTRTQTTTLK